MLAANILANSCRIGASSAAVSTLVTRSTIPYLSCSPYQQQQQLTTTTPLLPQTSQQLRFIRKTYRFRYAFGEKPLYTDHMYNEAVEQGRLDELGYKQIRFAASYETNSPLQDDMVEKYISYILFDGRRGLKYHLMHDTFYEIKSIQYKRMLKRKQAEAEGKQVKESTLQTDDSEEDKIELNPVLLLHKAIKNCTPLLITRKVKRGGATYQVPYPVVAKESEFLAIRWLHNMINDRPKPRLIGYNRELARELIDAAHNRGKVVKKKDDIHKLAQTNKAYAHYRWG